VWQTINFAYIFMYCIKYSALIGIMNTCKTMLKDVWILCMCTKVELGGRGRWWQHAYNILACLLQCECGECKTTLNVTVKTMKHMTCLSCWQRQLKFSPTCAGVLYDNVYWKQQKKYINSYNEYFVIRQFSLLMLNYSKNLKLNWKWFIQHVL